MTRSVSGAGVYSLYMLSKPKNTPASLLKLRGAGLFSRQMAAPVTMLLTILSQLVVPTAAQAENLQPSNYLRQNQVSSSFQTLLAENDEVTAPKPDKVVRAVMTAYTSTADQTDDSPCITADGTNLCKRGLEDVLAANWLPMGTQVKIPSLYGDRIFEVHDRMNARYGYGRMDIWLNTSRAEARKFGVKRVDVEIYYVKKEIAQR